MLKEFLKKYSGVVLFYIAVVGVAYILCTDTKVATSRNNNNVSISMSVNN